MVTQNEKICKSCFLIKAVKEMREAQKAYFKIRGFSELNKAKALEMQVDALLAEYEISQVKQAELF
ncbi:hypothetical protein [Treponema pedis]|uniref:hypothetical protein n=1 Tax=Treponema pedis TaxID=409322 RepID=UPI003D23C12A